MARLRALGRAVVLGLLVTTSLAVLAPSSQAAEAESQDAGVLVQQAVALIANDAGLDRVVTQVQAALAAPKHNGVDRARIRQALAVLTGPGAEPSRLRAASTLLAAADLSYIAGLPRSFATGEETGTTAVLPEFRPPRGVRGAGDGALLAVGIGLVLAGLLLSRRLRPAHTVAELRRRAGKEPVTPT